MPVALITGANRGLGFEFARQYLGEGWRVFAACRDPGVRQRTDVSAIPSITYAGGTRAWSDQGTTSCKFAQLP